MSKKTNEQTIIEKNTLDIHGKQYLTVAGRLQLMHEAVDEYKVETEVLTHSPVVVKATVTILSDGKVVKTTTGISAANPAKSIEKMSPYEVAETSAVGRALGFAGYGLIDSVASADEMHKAGISSGDKQAVQAQNAKTIAEMSGINPKDVDEVLGNSELLPWEGKTPPCETCGKSTVLKNGTSAKGKDWEALFCSSGEREHTKFL